MNTLYIINRIPKKDEDWFEICHTFDKNEAIDKAYNDWNHLTPKEQENYSVELFGYHTAAETAEEAYEEIVENACFLPDPDICEELYSK